MSTIHRKSAKGQAEIETRAHRLPPRLRSVLVMVDGRRSDDEFARLLPQAADALARLRAEGFIEPVAEAPAAPRAAVPPTASAPPPGPPPQAPASLPFDELKRQAVRQLIDLVGPLGEGVAMRIEKARRPEELAPLLATAAQLVANVRGARAGADFAARFSAR
ncbi:MAG: hypothetical protein MUF03_09815 [Rubrivivax sp.]|jgi:hypothetical protein|nr:hypothetical protein [Rubrivivax sp.]